ncbi:LysR substrate-binding domain-containing protein [Aestuariibacter sp. AA17]|uniref:LysR substrate-binding domain-containing protein n=1 Tax=Fluctibacter corallii TaxID=2984329 RepID=A0ABT3A836_9ALTE|nr:LysR substrate-binding domain-containing protein [Aestuariibacter sp. AA17]MCV2884849.1 LysR substrate-binding domain-containing protein [Aestuariibacter sp. AA17]
MVSWEGVIEFVRVAQYGSFTRASKHLSTSVAQVSRRVAALEARLGCKLLHRSTRTVTLSEAGQLFFAQCQPLITGLEEAERSVSELQHAPRGLIRLTAPVAFGESYIAPLVNQFLRHYPDISLECHFTNATLDLIEQRFDLAVRIGKLQDSTLMARKLASRQSYVCASPQYIKEHGEPFTLSELKHHRCLKGSLDVWRFTVGDTQKSMSVNGKIQYNSGHALKDAALRGLGLVQLPDYYVQEAMQSGQLIEVLSQYRDAPEGIWAIYPHNRHLTPKIRLLIDFLESNLA